MKKDLAIKKLRNFAKMYSDNLLGHKILFVYQDIPSIDFIEVVFQETNFRHLTGVRTEMSNATFFSACLEQKLSPEDFVFSEDGTTTLKFQVLDKVLRIHETARFIGDYNGQRPLLMTDKLVGDMECCLGLQLGNKYYSPNTVLKSNIRQEVHRPARTILATLRTERYENKYGDLCYLKSEAPLSDLDLPTNLVEILNPSLLS